MFDTSDHATPVSTADEVVTAEVKVAQNRGCTLPPAAEKLAEEMYKNLTMGCDAYLDMLPRVEDNRIKTDMNYIWQYLQNKRNICYDYCG